MGRQQPQRTGQDRVGGVCRRHHTGSGMSGAARPAGPPARTWAITTTSGHTASGYLPAWAHEDPSTTGVPPGRLPAALADITHEAPFGGQLLHVNPAAAEPGQDAVA